MSDDGTTLTTETNGRESHVDGVRTYRGRRLEDILPRIREELGPDAVILSEREGLVGGFGGFFAQRLIEVQARRGPAIDVYDEDGEDELGTSQPPDSADATDEFMTALRRAASAWSEDGDVEDGEADEEPDTQFPHAAQEAAASAGVRPASFRRVPAPPAAAGDPAPFPGATLAASARPALPRPAPPSSELSPVEPPHAAEAPEAPAARKPPAPAQPTAASATEIAPADASLDVPGRKSGHIGPLFDEAPHAPGEAAPAAPTDAPAQGPDGPAAVGARATPARPVRKARPAQKPAKATSGSARKAKGPTATSAEKTAPRTRGRARPAGAQQPDAVAAPVPAPARAPAEPPFLPVTASPVSPLPAQAPIHAASPPAAQVPIPAASPPAAQAPIPAASPPVSAEGAQAPYRSRFAARTRDAGRPASAVLSQPDTQRSASAPARASPAPPTPAPLGSAPETGTQPLPMPPAPASPPPSAHLSPAPRARRGLRLRDAITRRLSAHPSAAASGAVARPLDTVAAATMRDELTACGVSQSMASVLIASAAAHGSPLAPNHDLREGARAQLVRRIIQPPPLPATGAAIAFVGAGGAGKTSCAAAIATAYAGASTLAVSALSLRSADGGRALGELLRSSGIGVTAVDAAQAARMISERRPGGLVIVDTAAVSPGDSGAMQALAGDLEQLALDAVYVALPATLGSQAARSALASFGVLRPAAIVVTHADETDQIGVSLEIAAANRIPVAYIHAGVDPRTALTQLDPHTIAARLLP